MSCTYVGILSVIGGGWWVAQAFREISDTTNYGYLAAAQVLAAWPGLMTIVAGTLFLAAGEALVRLADIHRNTRRTARAIEQLAKGSE